MTALATVDLMAEPMAAPSVDGWVALLALRKVERMAVKKVDLMDALMVDWMADLKVVMTAAWRVLKMAALLAVPSVAP